jgi:putative heme-binding domain-containing protein
MIWYGIEPLVPADPGRAIKLLANARIPLVREYIARRLAALPATPSQPLPGLPPLVELLRRTDDPLLDRDILRGISEALRGRRQAPLPKDWPGLYPRLAESPYPEVREKAVSLAVVFGDEQATVTLRKIVVDGQASPALRQSSLQTLVFQQKADLVPLLHGLVTDPVLRAPAIRALAGYSDEQTPALLLKHYGGLGDSEKADAIATLASRPAYALVLLDAIERKQVPRNDLSAFTVRAMLGLGSKDVTDRLNKVWGPVRPASTEKAALLTKYKAMLTPEVVKKADRGQGRTLYVKNCAACHRLFDDGGAIGPDLTGSQRTNLDYVLENMIDPSAIVAGDYLVTLVETKNGRVLTGIIKQEDDRSITVQTQNEAIILPKDEVATRAKQPLSLMPEGMLDKLTPNEVRDLIAYLAGPGQVPLPKK